MKEPLVSIIVPTYNRANLIHETIQSVLDQTFKNWELIIVDDGSVDETYRVVEKFSDNRICYHKINHSGLLGLVRNYGITNSKGKYIAFLDSDDRWIPQKLETQVSLFENSPLTAFIITHIELFGPASHEVQNYSTLIEEDLLERYIEEHHFVFYPSALIFKRSALNKTGMLNEFQTIGADTEFFMKLCASFKGSFLSERLVQIRKHQQNTSTQIVLPAYFEMIETIRKLHDEKIIRKEVYHQTLSKFYYKIGLLLIRSNQPKKAASLFRQYVSIRLLDWKGWVRLVQSLTQTIIVTFKGRNP